MKRLAVISIILAALSACNQSASNQVLQKRIDSLEQRLANSYKPGFGEFMSGIQIHHAKLWFAGKEQNWKLAEFEINEIQEALSGIKTYCADRSETQTLPMIEPFMDSITRAIQNKDLVQFNNTYILLTSTCNNCHQATQHEFNVITIPTSPPFTNQDFKVQKPMQ